jgi:hypothetical protein
MGRKQAQERHRRRRRKEIEETGFWSGLSSRIDDGKLIPIISDAVYSDPIFDIDGDGILGVSVGEEPDEDVACLSIGEQLAQEYAYYSRFPLAEGHRMANVALFNSVTNKTDRIAAKSEYLNWLKSELLFRAEEDADVEPATIAELKDELEKPFAHVVNRLGYPKATAGQRDVLELLAQLKLPVYITTSYFDFLERALLANRVTPQTQICFWNGKPQSYIDVSHETRHHPQPSSENPIVYHLFGHEAYPDSLVLTEDDFLDYLVKLSADLGQKEPILPHYLRERLTLSSLVLLGYRPGDWDFRILFRGLIAAASNIEMLNLAIQFDDRQSRAVASTEEIRAYLERYFHPLFDVEWSSTYDFVAGLYDTWDRNRR